MVVIATPKTVVLRDMATDMQGASSITGEPGSGKLFIEDVVGCLNFDSPQKVWARQWNFENSVHEATNAGGRWWIMGYKTEGTKTLKTSAGGWTELLGGMLYSNKMVPADVPAFINEEGHVSLTYTENSDVADRFITEHVRETRDGETKTQVRDDLPSRGYGRYAGLYVGYKESPPVEGTGGGGGGESVGAGGSEGVGGGGSGTGGTQEVSGDEGGCGCELPGRESRSSVPISALVTALAAALVRWKRQGAR